MTMQRNYIYIKKFTIKEQDRDLTVIRDLAVLLLDIQNSMIGIMTHAYRPSYALVEPVCDLHSVSWASQVETGCLCWFARFAQLFFCRQMVSTMLMFSGVVKYTWMSQLRANAVIKFINEL
jgi:hypothetical protein